MLWDGAGQISMVIARRMMDKETMQKRGTTIRWP